MPLAIASGSMDGHTWLITLTSQRIILLDKGMFYGLKQVDISLEDIVSVSGSTGFTLGEITISTAAQNHTIKNVSKLCVGPFTNAVNAFRNIIQSQKQPGNIHQINETHTADDVIDKMERLAKLKQDGILTKEEFTQQKQRILNAHNVKE
ncbi:PH domain-containing protein [Kosakonia sp.]|uniref:PH domain-containing protein n=1 Tax=Kosakonia sp. TaxID=1916651 RepID=UPI00390CA3E2